MFDGKGFAEIRSQRLKTQISGRKLKLVSFYEESNQASAMYTKVKARVAVELGVEFEKWPIGKFGELIERFNTDPRVNGIMVQLPVDNAGETIELIRPEKDVDGLREDSPFKTAAVRAVLTILNTQIPNPKNILIVGSKGFVGGRLVRELPGVMVMDKEDFDPEKIKAADVVISCTGQAGLIKPEMVKNGFVAIDVGYPQAEFTEEALAKASFYTPVPGGVGPVTVISLFENLWESRRRR